MISILQGQPGGGKTMYAIEQIWDYLCQGKEVWTNVDLVPSWHVLVASRGVRAFTFTAEKIAQDAQRIAQLYHRIDSLDELPWDIRKEGSRLAVFDECQLMFNTRDAKGRGAKWLKWFSQHRKLGYDCILIAQDHRMIDAQLRSLAEQLITSFSMVRFSIPLVILTIPVGAMVTHAIGPMFYRKCTFVGMNGMILWRQFSVVTGMVARIYDTRQVYGMTREDGTAINFLDELDGTPARVTRGRIRVVFGERPAAGPCAAVPWSPVTGAGPAYVFSDSQGFAQVSYPRAGHQLPAVPDQVAA